MHRFHVLKFFGFSHNGEILAIICHRNLLRFLVGFTWGLFYRLVKNSFVMEDFMYCLRVKD